jgi:DNA-binding winged helix-turn-helix (wHTH) protein/tetratricopeptide (TPR) repeat protein
MAGHIVYEFGAYRLDPADKSLVRDGAPVALTPKAFDTLVVLVDCHPRLVTKDELLARVWPGTFVEDNNLAQYVSLLRRTLADGAGADAVIETVPRRGYRFRLPVERTEAAPVGSSTTAMGDRDHPPTLPAVQEPTLSVPTPPRRLSWPAAVAAVLLVAGATTAYRFVNGDTSPQPVAQAASRDPQAHLAYLSGRAAFAQGYSDTVNQARARADLERSVALDPGFAPAWALLAQVYGARYRTAMDRDPAMLDAAERAARTAITLDPRLPAGHLALADVHYNRRENDKVHAALDAGHDVLTGDAAYWHLRSFLAKREGRWRDSEAALAAAFDLDAPATAEGLAVHYLQLRQYADARRVLAVANASSRTAAVVPDAWTRFSEHGDIAAARSVLEAALGARTPPDARVLSLLAQLEWFDGRADRALVLIDRMDPAGAWLAPNFRFPAAIAAGDVLDGLGRHAEARARYADAVAVLEMRRHAAPDDEKIAAALGLAYAGLGRADDALRHARRAVTLLPRDRDAGEGPLYLYLLARVHARLGQLADATAVLDSMFDAPGFYSDAWVARDPSFVRLRADEAFATQLDRWTTRRGDVLLSGAAGSPPRVTTAATLGQ